MKRKWILLLSMLVLPVILLAQDSTTVPPVIPPPGDWVGLISAASLPVATFLGAGIVWAASHYWPWFNAISQNPDGSPSAAGTLAKRLAVVVSCTLVLMGLRVIGATPPTGLPELMGSTWALLVEGFATGLAGMGVFKLATTSPAK